MTASPFRSMPNGSHETFASTGSWQAEVDDDRPIGELVKDLTRHAQELVRGEIDLAKEELTGKVKAMAVYVGMAAGAAVFAIGALLYLGHAIAQAFDVFMPEWAAYLLTFALLMAVAGVLGFLAAKGFQKTSIAPTESLESAKEDLTWVKTHT